MQDILFKSYDVLVVWRVMRQREMFYTGRSGCMTDVDNLVDVHCIHSRPTRDRLSSRPNL